MRVTTAQLQRSDRALKISLEKKLTNTIELRWLEH